MIYEDELPKEARAATYTPRELSDEEREIIRRAQSFAPQVKALLADASALVHERARQHGAGDTDAHRSIALAKTNIQQGLLWLENAMRAEAAF